jgi:hypothetical protein
MLKVISAHIQLRLFLLSLRMLELRSLCSPALYLIKSQTSSMPSQQQQDFANFRVEPSSCTEHVMWNMVKTQHADTMESSPAKQLPFVPQISPELATNGHQAQTAQGYLKNPNFLHSNQRLDLQDEQNLDNARSFHNRDKPDCSEQAARIYGAVSTAR